MCSGAMLQDHIGNQRAFYFFYVGTCLLMSIVLEEAFERYQCV